MALSLQLNVYFNSLKLGDMLYMRKATFIREFENSMILLKQQQKKNKQSKTKIFPITESASSNVYAASNKLVFNRYSYIVQYTGITLTTTLIRIK
jgi:hypothetical protein